MGRRWKERSKAVIEISGLGFVEGNLFLTFCHGKLSEETCFTDICSNHLASK